MGNLLGNKASRLYQIHARLPKRMYIALQELHAVSGRPTNDTVIELLSAATARHEQWRIALKRADARIYAELGLVPLPDPGPASAAGVPAEAQGADGVWTAAPQEESPVPQIAAVAASPLSAPIDAQTPPLVALEMPHYCAGRVGLEIRWLAEHGLIPSFDDLRRIRAELSDADREACDAYGPVVYVKPGFKPNDEVLRTIATTWTRIAGDLAAPAAGGYAAAEPLSAATLSSRASDEDLALAERLLAQTDGEAEHVIDEGD